MLSPFTLCHSPGSLTGCSASRGSALYGPARRAQAVCRDLLTEAVAVAVRRQVLEAGVLADEGHVHRADGAVTLLADDQLGQALVVGVVRIVDLVAIDEGDDVCILFNRSTFTKIRHHRA